MSARDVGGRFNLRPSLLGVAEHQLKEGNYDLSIIISHTACEVYTARVFGRLIEHRGLSRRDLNLPQNYDMAKDKLRQIYISLTGEKIQDQDPANWQRFKEGTKLRHQVVHAGFMPTKADAELFLTAVKTLMQQMQETVYKLTGVPLPM